jgi:hypothetical protein
MVSGVGGVLVLTSLILSLTASAAEVTDLPPKFRGDVHVAYGGDFEQAGISEPNPQTGLDRTFALRAITRQELGIRLEGAVWDGVAITLGLPITIQQRIAWPAAREMLFEPTTGSGSYVNGQSIEADELVTGGLQGVWLGVAAAPLRASLTPRFPIDTRIDFGVRLSGAKGTPYGGNRGGSLGGPAIRLAAAFSHRTGRGEPYLSIDWVHELGGKSDAIGNDATQWATDLEIKPPDRLDVTAGVELIAREVKGTASRVAVDAHVGFGYRSSAQVPSGFFLPDVLPASRSIAVTTSEYVQLGGGAALDYHINEWIGLRLGADGRWMTPHRIEHPYTAKTDPESWGVSWYLNLVGRIRLKGEPVAP